MNMPVRERLTETRVSCFELPSGKSQCFLWDSDSIGLGVRVTKGSRSYIFQCDIHGRSVRLTIGRQGVWKLAQARIEARRLRTIVDKGIDPRHDRMDQKVKTEARWAEQKLNAVTVRQAWDAYCEANQRSWGEHHKNDHLAMARKPGELIGRRATPSVGGPLSVLMDVRLAELSPHMLEVWLREEVARRPRAAEKGFRLFRAFLNWCADQDAYKEMVQAGSNLRRVRKVAPRMRAKTDSLQREMLPDFFSAISRLPNRLHASFFLLLILTGARPGELLQLRWDCVSLRWRTLRIRDKEGSHGEEVGMREVPIGLFAAGILEQLRLSAPTFPDGGLRSAYVFYGRNMGEDKPMVGPNAVLSELVRQLGLPHLTLHGLRRSYSNFCEWLEWPAGVKAQIMGHKPSATAERHYTQRPLDLLRRYQDRMESWVLSEAGVSTKVLGLAVARTEDQVADLQLD